MWPCLKRILTLYFSFLFRILILFNHREFSIICILFHRMSDRIEPREINFLLERVLNAKSAQELDSEAFSRQMMRLSSTTFECSGKKIPEPAASEIIIAFLQGHPGAALCRLVELRSGRSLTDQTTFGLPVSIENSFHFTINYRHLLYSFANAMEGSANVCREYISSSCARAALLELESIEFAQHRDKSPTDSPTAKAISLHLTLIFNVSTEKPLTAELGEQLRRAGFFPIIKEHTKSRSLFSLLSIRTC